MYQLKEEWRSAPGWEGLYEVSNYGRIRNIKGPVPKIVSIQMRINPKNAGVNDKYTYVELYGESFKKGRHRVAVHLLVARAFIPNPENKPLVNHIDGNKLNSNAYNLEWATHQENANHAYAMGLNKSLGSLKLTKEDVGEIKTRFNQLIEDLKNEFNVSGGLIKQVITNKYSKNSL